MPACQKGLNNHNHHFKDGILYCRNLIILDSTCRVTVQCLHPRDHEAKVIDIGGDRRQAPQLSFLSSVKNDSLLFHTLPTTTTTLQSNHEDTGRVEVLTVRCSRPDRKKQKREREGRPSSIPPSRITPPPPKTATHSLLPKRKRPSC